MQKRMIVGLVAVVILAGGLLVSYARAQGGSLTAQDFVEIQQLYTKYNYAIDSGDVEAYVALYTPDGAFNSYVGQDGLRTFMKNRTGGNRRHWNSNLMITPTPDGARGQVYLLLVDVGVRPPVLSTAAQYDDLLVKTAQGWRFKKRTTRAEGPPASAAR